MAYSPSFLRAILPKPVHGAGGRQHRTRSQVQKLLDRDKVAPGHDFHERAAGVEVEERLDRLAEARSRESGK